MRKKIYTFVVWFQFTHPGGVRRLTTLILSEIKLFQFTHPGGVRRTNRLYRRDYSYRFNSRTREGCDSSAYQLWLYPFLFQFTHPGGVRQCGAKLRIMGRINKRNLRLEVLL